MGNNNKTRHSKKKNKPIMMNNNKKKKTKNKMKMTDQTIQEYYQISIETFSENNVSNKHKTCLRKMN